MLDFKNYAMSCDMYFNLQKEIWSSCCSSYLIICCLENAEIDSTVFLKGLNMCITFRSNQKRMVGILLSRVGDGNCDFIRFTS